MVSQRVDQLRLAHRRAAPDPDLSCALHQVRLGPVVVVAGAPSFATHGASKEKAARIANAAANTSRSAVGRKGGRSGDYEDWTKGDLMTRARELGIEGRSSMSKAQLVDALRNH